MISETTSFDPAEYLTEPEDQLELIMDAYHSGDPEFLANAFATVERAIALKKAARGPASPHPRPASTM